MKNHRLYELFHTLDKKELKEIAKFIDSPIFNRRELVCKLFEYMVKHRTKGWKMEQLFQHLYPGEVFHIQKLHHAHSFLLQRIESYLLWASYSEDETQAHLELLGTYRKRQVHKLYNKQLKISHSKIEKDSLRNVRHLSQRYEILKEEFYYQKEKGRNMEFNLQQLSDMQDIAFMADKLKNACTMISHQTFKKETYNSGLLTAVLNKIEEEEKYLSYPAISIYYHAYRALAYSENEQDYYALKELMQLHIDAFSEQEKRDIFILTANYCIRRLNAGDKHFTREAFETYRLGLERKVLMEQDILSKWTYNNIIVLGLNLKEFDWVEQFIYDYKKHLEANTREDTFNFNLSKFYVEKKDYKKAMPLLIQTKYDDLLHTLGAKNMLLKMYVELKEWDALESLIESYKHFLSRQKDIGYHKENYLNTISIIKKIMKLEPYDKKAKEQLSLEIKNTKVLISRDWLLEQVGKV